jgi:hypothetical protein
VVVDPGLRLLLARLGCRLASGSWNQVLSISKPELIEIQKEWQNLSELTRSFDARMLPNSFPTSDEAVVSAKQIQAANKAVHF